jgi:creatinine amidohydrolase
VAAVFSGQVPLATAVFADPELVAGRFSGDHAGKFEISQLLAIRPDLVDLSQLARRNQAGAGGRLALGDDAGEATAEFGRAILEAQLAALGDVIQIRLAAHLAASSPTTRRTSLPATEEIWSAVRRDPRPFITGRPATAQLPVSGGSRWKSGESFAFPAST